MKIKIAVIIKIFNKKTNINNKQKEINKKVIKIRMNSQKAVIFKAMPVIT